MRLSLPTRDAVAERPEPWLRWLVRHAVVVWLLVVEPVSFALTLDRALPRMSSFGPTAWTLVTLRIGLASVGIAVASRLRTRDARSDGGGSWRAVAWWALAAIAVTLVERAWPELPTNLAPSEARVAAVVAIVRDGALALVAAWLARTDAAVAANAAGTGDSS